MKNKRLGFILFFLVFGCVWGIPDIFISRFHTFPVLWLEGGIGIIICIYAFFSSSRLFFPKGGVLAGILSGIILCLFEGNQIEGLAGGFGLSAVISFLLGNWKDWEKQLPFCFHCLALLAGLQACWGIGQYWHVLPVYHTKFLVTGTFDNPAGFAGCLSVLFPFALYKKEEESWKSWVWKGIIIFLIVWAMLVSASRTGILVILVIGGYWLSGQIMVRHKMKTWRTRKRMLVWGSIVIILGISLYFWKQDSVDGRLLIWKISASMVKDMHWNGEGTGAFQAKDMLYQADYFVRHGEDKWELLADNVKHPFNEYLKLLIEYGCIGVVLILFYLLAGKYYYQKYKIAEKNVAWYCIGAVALCNCFSYPFSYPVVWLIVAFSSALIFAQRSEFCTGKFVFISRYLLGIFSLFFLLCLTHRGKNERLWFKIAHRSLAGETEQVLPIYEKLYRDMKNNGLFLYNYGAELHEINRYKESAERLEECLRYMNDVDVQILLAENYMQTEQYEQAEKCLHLAAHMCPNRFLPLYYLVNLYDKIGKKDCALQLAKELIRKKVKISSYMIEKIQMEMKEYVYLHSNVRL